MNLQFHESVCEEYENRQKKEKGVIGSKYWCYQLRKEITIFRDVSNLPVEVIVNHRSECELRCIEKNCEGKHRRS